VQNFLWRSRGVAKVVRQVVEKPLNARRRLERTQAPQFGRREAESVCAVHERSSPLSNACYVSRKLSECARASRRFLRGASVTKLRVIFIIRQRSAMRKRIALQSTSCEMPHRIYPLLLAQAKGRNFHFCF